MTNKELFGAYRALSNALQAKLSARVGFPISSNLKKVEDAAKEVEEYRQKILKEYAGEDFKKDENNQVIFPTGEAKENAEREINELFEQESEVELRTVSEEDFGEVDIEPEILFGLLSIGMIE